MRVLVTGSSGFIGTSFCERFHRRNGFDIVGADLVEPRERFPRVDYMILDLTDRLQVLRLIRTCEPELIVHLAAQARVEPSLVDPAGTYRSNVTSTVNLLEGALELGRGLECFVYASSETVYGPADVYPTPEAAAVRPGSPYAASKAACETLVRAADGLPALILRSAMGYGPRSNPREQVVAKFIVKALRDEPIRFPRGLREDLHPTRDINHVQNYLDAIELALSGDVMGTFNVGSGEETSILELARNVVDLAGSGCVSFDASYAYRPGEVGLRTWLDTRKADEAFGYRPAISLGEGLRSTLRWYSDHTYFWDAPPAPLVEARNGGRGE